MSDRWSERPRATEAAARNQLALTAAEAEWRHSVLSVGGKVVKVGSVLKWQKDSDGMVEN